MSYGNGNDDSQGAVVFFSIGGFAIVGLLALVFFGFPVYNVWSNAAASAPSGGSTPTPN